MWTYIEITDAMFFLACGNRPVKLIASVFSDTYYHWSAIIPTALSFLSYKLVSFLTCYPLQPL